MKKQYINPEMQVVEIAMKQILMVSGPDVFGGSDDPVIDNPGNILAPPMMPEVPDIPELPIPEFML
jgi:hypothetical protein